MKIGLLRESKIPADTRVPLTPEQCRTVEEEFPGFRVLVQPSSIRCYPDQMYEKQGILVKEDLSDCDILMGVKEVEPGLLISGKTYFFFSHTIKKQRHNRQLLRTILDKQVNLIDYELLTDSKGIRIIGFGRWAGLIGSYLGVRAMCMKGGLKILPMPQEFHLLEEMMKVVVTADLPPFRIILTGDGRVAGGAEEMLNAFGVQKITVEDYLDHLHYEIPVYVQLDPGKYNRMKNGGSFELEHFFRHPGDYESDFNRFCDATDLLIMAAYWDPGAPVLFTTGQMRESGFGIQVIADITCDLNGSIPSTIRTTTFQDPYYDFNRWTGMAEPPFSGASNITVMSIDHLPCGLPREASADFGRNIIRNIFPLLARNDPERILQRATIAKEGQLTPPFRYLYSWVVQPEAL